MNTTIFHLPNECLCEIISNCDSNLTFAIISMVSQRLKNIVIWCGFINESTTKYKNMLRMAARSDSMEIVRWMMDIKRPDWIGMKDLMYCAIAGGAIHVAKFLDEIGVQIDAASLRRRKIIYTGDIYRFVLSKKINISSYGAIPFLQLTELEISEIAKREQKHCNLLIKFIYNSYDEKVVEYIVPLLLKEYGLDIMISSIPDINTESRADFIFKILNTNSCEGLPIVCNV